MTTAFTIGVLAGWLQLAGLRYTVESLSFSRAPRDWVVGSRMVRTVLTLALLYFFCRLHLPIALAGWWVARTLAVKRWS